MEASKINFDKEKLEALKKAVEEAKEVNSTSFKFEGHTLLTRYAEYLVEYLTYQFDTGGEDNAPHDV